MKKLLMLCALFAISGCSKKYYTTVSNPETVLPSDSIEMIVADENEFRLSQGQLPLTSGLTCAVGKFTSMPATLPASVPSLEARSFTYYGNFNQEDSDVSQGLNIIPSNIRLNYISNYMIRCTGQIVITEGGLYNFGLRSDDGALVKIDGSNIILNDGIHAPSNAYGARSLKQGVHSFQLDFMQNGGQQALTLTANGILVPAENFYR